MKKVLFLMLWVLTACGGESKQDLFSDEIDPRFHELEFSLDHDDFKHFYREFISEGNPEIKKENIYFAVDTTGWLQEKGVKGVYIFHNGKKHIIVEPEFWAWPENIHEDVEATRLKRQNREYVIWHQLGHAILNRPDVDHESIMNPNITSESVVTYNLSLELFK